MELHLSNMRLNRLFSLLPLLAAVATASAQVSTPQTDLLYGHFETHIDYTLSPGNPNAGWQFYVSYNKNDDFNDRTQIVRLNPATTRIVATPPTQGTISAAISELGPVGQPIWVLPQTNVIGAPYLGTRAVFDAGIFKASFMGFYVDDPLGSITLALHSVTGTGPAAGGHFGLYTSDFAGPLILMNSADGIDANDQIETLTPDAHSHFFWSFTKPGNYAVTFRGHGQLLTGLGGASTQGFGTFNFSVPFSSRLQNTATLRFGAGSEWHVLLEDATNAVAYESRQGFLEAATAATSTVQGTFPGATRQMSLTLSALGSGVANIVGQTPALAAAGVPAGLLQSDAVTVRLIGVHGPGQFALLNGTGTALLMNSADGISAADSVTVSRSANLSALAAFTADGLYRVTLQLSATTTGGQSVTSQPFTLSFGSNRNAPFTYTQWRQSFETAHGLSSGALSSASADFDQDGMRNGHEFLLFWHGCNPARADLGLNPVPQVSGGFLGLDFLRDTYKDALNEGSFQINPMLSTNLSTWSSQSPRNPGRPLETYETGADKGNALGRILLRRLRIPVTGTVDKAFGRFQAVMP